MTELLADKLSSIAFNPDSFVRQLATNSFSADDLLTTKQRVQHLAEETNGLLKKNVYKNYMQFIETAKEISYLESEMYQLSHMLTEEQVILNSLMEISITGEKAADRQTDKKDDENGKSLSTLLERVEGCASILDIRGRRLLHSGELYEADASEKSARVYAVLLNESLMVATALSNRRGPIQYRFQGLYELDSIAVVNLKDTNLLKNAFKLLMFPDSRLFHCETFQEKKEWLSAIEQAKKENMNNTGRNLMHIKNPFDEVNPFEEDEDEERAEHEFPDWLIELPEDLDVCIAQRDFEGAVALVDRAKQHLNVFPGSAATKEIRSRIDHRIKHLVDVLMNELRVSPDRSLRGGSRAARRAVTLLACLGKSSQACSLFLSHRGAILKHSLRQQQVEGATVPYISRLCGVFFTNVIETGKEFTSALDSSAHTSAFAVWAKSELRQFHQIFSRHVFTPQVALSTIAECVALVVIHCKQIYEKMSYQQLTEIGLELASTLNLILYPDVERTIVDSRDKLLEAIKLRGNEDQWRPQNFQIKVNADKFLDDMVEIGIASIHSYVYDECWLSLTSNTTSFTKAYLNFLDDLIKLYSPSVHHLVSDSLVITFRAQLKHAESSLDTFKLEGNFIRKNAAFLIDTLLPVVERRYEESLGHSCTPLSEMCNEMSKLTTRSCVTKYSSTSFL